MLSDAELVAVKSVTGTLSVSVIKYNIDNRLFEIIIRSLYDEKTSAGY